MWGPVWPESCHGNNRFSKRPGKASSLTPSLYRGANNVLKIKMFVAEAQLAVQEFCPLEWWTTEEPLDESERGKWKSWLKTQHSKTKIMISSPITSWWIELGNDGNSVSESCWVMSDSLSSPWNFPVKNTGVGSLSLLQPTQGSNYGLLYCKLPAEPQGKPKNSGVVSLSFSRGSSGHRNRAGSPALQVDFFTNCAIREAWKQREILVLEAPESLQPWN